MVRFIRILISVLLTLNFSALAADQKNKVTSKALHKAEQKAQTVQAAPVKVLSTKTAEAKHTPAVKIAPAKLEKSPVEQWKEIVAEKGNTISLKQKIQALVKLSEVEGREITEFISIQKQQLETDLKMGAVPALKENKGLLAAYNRVLTTRLQNSVAERN